MSEVKRWEPRDDGWMVRCDSFDEFEESDENSFVEARDYDALLARYEALIKDAERLRVMADAYREALAVAYQATRQSRAGHRDSQGTHGANCPECIRAREARDLCDEILRNAREIFQNRQRAAIDAVRGGAK